MRPGLVLNGVGACVVCGRVLDHTGWTTTTATISISRSITISISITITITMTITLFNNIAILMLGLARVTLGVAGTPLGVRRDGVCTKHVRAGGAFWCLGGAGSIQR